MDVRYKVKNEYACEQIFCFTQNNQRDIYNLLTPPTNAKKNEKGEILPLLYC